MGKTQHLRSRNRFEQSPEFAYDEYVQRVYENKRVRQKKKLPQNAPPAFEQRSWAEWVDDCQQWRGMVLEGQYAHWCAAWNFLPMDETCPEWPCGCTIVEEVQRAGK